VAADYRRTAAHRRELLVDEPPFEPTTDPTQLAQLEHRERLDELDAVLSQLPVEQRTVFVLFELEEMSGEDIATMLEIPEGTVRSRLRLARQAFARIAAERRGDARIAAVGGAP
jgi:RNA polymerase sigma-70 factor (ECF subfamily)